MKLTDAQAVNIVGLSGTERFYCTWGSADGYATANQIKAFAKPVFGYVAGEGGAVTQQTSKATGVTINNACGQITTNNAALAAGAEASFIVTCSAMAATDLVVVNHVSGGTIGSYGVYANGGASGSFRVTITNLHTASRSEALVIGYAIVKATAA